MSRQRGLACCAVLAGTIACSSRDVPTLAAQHGPLPTGAAAQVGGDVIALDTVTRIAQAQRVAPAVARSLAISDALFAAGARSAFEGGSIVPAVERAAWARALLQGLKAEAIARGPVTDAEVTELTALRWQALDRPETVRTTHAVVRVERPEQDAGARAVADKIAAAVRGVTDPEAFMGLARAVPHEGFDVRAERLPALTADGRPYDPAAPPSDSERFDKDFSAAAHALAVGQISQPKKSAFGYHVILCEARLPAVQVPLEERRALLKDEIINNRADRLKQELLARLNSATPTLVPRSVDDLTAQVRVLE